MSTDAPRRPRGRPRDPSIPRRVLPAVRELAAERGLPVMGEGGMIYNSVSMSAVAELTGVGKPTLYLRWANLDAVVAAALDEVDLGGELGAVAREALDVLDVLVQQDAGRFLAALMAAGDSWRADLAERLTAAGHGAALPPFDATHERWAVGRRDGWAMGVEGGDLGDPGYTRGGLVPPGPGYGDPEAPDAD